ncbi:MAG: hypothetical protein BECKG1743D_GA0114223_103066 [Candidatus Kentron sp. G]|nr:MAG: hypothetical protein BECKG1743F_GA0114225_103205 [Candidatus Kentron sp. G]VFN00771.1 MAG: hypothetical protein BECKG1743E_GA0114224_103502 [Candidatus Kentron sp. G]VFN01751.1 MAG: hypothetical protein BECKG1743D_GA0114223_103066 [Candidatus Kentron sp. G]
MTIDTNPSIALIDSYWKIVEYHRNIKDLYRLLDARFAYGEARIESNPAHLPSIPEPRRIFPRCSWRPTGNNLPIQPQHHFAARFG